jgi:uncharacterized protein YdcH (DUF465 family)
MCDNKFPQESAFAFLEELKKLFLRKFTPGDIDKAIVYSFNSDKEFKNEMIKRIEYYNHNTDKGDNVSELKKGVLQFKDNVLDASDVLSQRDEKISLIVRKADQLRQDSSTYYKNVK